jgi:Protein of unknown function (DUF2867)
MKREPAFWSLALDDIPAPDYADVSIAVLPAGASTDPRAWAMSIFSLRTMPGWVRAALGLRQLLAPLIGVPRADHDVFAVRRVEGNEALLGIDDVHLDFRCGIGVDAAAGLVRVVTTVRLKGRRGRIYFWPVRLAHPVVVRSMLRRAVKRSL